MKPSISTADIHRAGKGELSMKLVKAGSTPTANSNPRQSERARTSYDIFFIVL